MKITDLSKVTVILRGYNTKQVLSVCESLKNTRLNTLEITTNSPSWSKSIREVKSKYPLMFVGAGTVLNIEHAIEAKENNADFILSPIKLDKETIEFCNKQGMLCVSAAMTPTEVYSAYDCGADVVKIFPARDLGKSFPKDLKAPLGDIKLMAVGGVNSANVTDLLNNGYDFVGIASGIFEKADIENMKVENLSKSAKLFEGLLK